MNKTVYIDKADISQKRDDYFDLLRAIAIIFVIFIHIFNRIPGVENNNGVYISISVWRTIISCAVPLFLAISGYFMAKKKVNNSTDYKAFLKKQIPRVYIPCFIFSIPYFYWEVKLSGFKITELLYLLFGGYSVYYFVLLIIIMYLLLPVLQKMSKSVKGLLLSIVISTIFIVLWTLFKQSNPSREIPLIFSAIVFPMWMMFFVIGLYYGNGNKIKIHTVALIFILITIIGLSLIETNYITQKSGFLNASQQKLSNSIFSLFVIILLFNLHRKYSFNSLTGKFFSYIGRISFGIYLLHMYILMYLSIFINSFYPGVELSQPLLMLTILLISILIISLVKRVNNKFATKYLGF